MFLSQLFRALQVFLKMLYNTVSCRLDKQVNQWVLDVVQVYCFSFLHIVTSVIHFLDVVNIKRMYGMSALSSHETQEHGQI